MPTTTTGIQTINVVIVQTEPDKQDRSIEFYELIGFEKRTDIEMGGGYRWVEVYPPFGNTAIALAAPRPGEKVTPTNTGIALATTDIDATHAELRSRGVDVDEEVSRMGDPVPPLFSFRDPEGHSLMIVELP